MNITTARIAAAGTGIAAALSFAAIAHAGTMPVTHPGEPTVAMTITNHSVASLNCCIGVRQSRGIHLFAGSNCPCWATQQ